MSSTVSGYPTSVLMIVLRTHRYDNRNNDRAWSRTTRHVFWERRGRQRICAKRTGRVHRKTVGSSSTLCCSGSMTPRSICCYCGNRLCWSCRSCRHGRRRRKRPSGPWRERPVRAFSRRRCRWRPPCRRPVYPSTWWWSSSPGAHRSCHRDGGSPGRRRTGTFVAGNGTRNGQLTSPPIADPVRSWKQSGALTTSSFIHYRRTCAHVSLALNEPTGGWRPRTKRLTEDESARRLSLLRTGGG